MNIVKMIQGCIDDLTIKLETVKERMEVENELAALTSFDIVWALKPVLLDLSSHTKKPYMDYLEEVKEMILEGKEVADVFYHYDMLLYRLEEGERHE